MDRYDRALERLAVCGDREERIRLLRSMQRRGNTEVFEYPKVEPVWEDKRPKGTKEGPRGRRRLTWYEWPASFEEYNLVPDPKLLVLRLPTFCPVCGAEVSPMGYPWNHGTVKDELEDQITMVLDEFWHPPYLMYSCGGLFYEQTSGGSGEMGDWHVWSGNCAVLETFEEMAERVLKGDSRFKRG